MADQAVEAPALTALLASLADNKYFLGRRYAEWCTAAPTLESAVAAASMAQDEIGHARSFYPVLQDVAGRSEETEPETRTQFMHVPFLGRPFESWTDFIAANFLFDSSLTILLEAGTDSTFHPLAQRARRILEEEPLHWLHASGWTRRLAARGGGVKSSLSASLATVAPEARSYFDIAVPELEATRTLDATSTELRSRFSDRVNPVLEASDLPLV